MKIELKKIKFSEAMSEETNAFTADLYINGKKRGYCNNTGQGGCTDYHSFVSDDNKVIAEAEAHYKSLPKVRSEEYNFEYQPSLESTIDDLLSDWFKAKHLKKLEKLMVNHILIGESLESRHISKIKYSIDLAKARVDVLQSIINNTKQKHLKDNDVILNTNFKGLDVIL